MEQLVAYQMRDMSPQVLGFIQLQTDFRNAWERQCGISTPVQKESLNVNNNDQILTDILRREGGFVDDADDPGGPTNFGLTIPALSEYYGRPVGAHEVETLTAGIARVIYADLYIEKPGFNLIRNDYIRALVVDCGVNNGRGRAIKWLQHAVGAVADGVFGPRTVAALEGRVIRSVYYDILKQRYSAYADLVKSKSVLVKFLPGWMARANEFLGASV